MLKNKNFRFNLGLILSTGFAATTYFSPQFTSKTMSRVKDTARFESTLTNGTYLYGQSHLPEQIGREYLVFQVKQNRVVGAVYYPQSEFACFYGKITRAKMNLFVVHPYDRTINPYSIALDSSVRVATTGNEIESSTTLVGYQKISNLSDNDRRMLEICLEENLTRDRN
ncbi:MAG: hypothetical protein QNJ38_04260 [Prochloraceae cyanobacterium]|nr:hypothetical protein [Prochloraceae cyanobacterium]